jgi:hypothetical protein
VPFRYLNGPGTTPPPTPCDGCDGHIDVSSLVGLFRIGGGEGFHQVIEGQAGVTRYSKLRADDGTELAPDTDQDFTFALGYGVGYGLGPRFQISVVQDFGFNLHQKAGLTNNANTTIQNRVTRLTLRYGLFSQKPKV